MGVTHLLGVCQFARVRRRSRRVMPGEYQREGSGGALVKSEQCRRALARKRSRYNSPNVRLYGEAGSADTDAAQTFLVEVQNLVKEKGYFLDQIFNFDETNLYLKRICAAKDCVAAKIGANVSGDSKLKPLVIHHHVNP
ncbi:hypothetical protein M514_25357 [Trichuris suis]|uniref:Uncharacterized protein n=1 Tax=Trichuris suis TaxID=68888 RepID=A0A085MZ61_9BILA|nr:hypothetical protein M514_25357 [Trichuris suis]